MAYLILLEMGSVKSGTECHIPIIRMLIKNKKSTPCALASFSLPTRSLFAITTSSRRC